MIVANVVIRERDGDTDWGTHQFATAPHAGDHALIYWNDMPWGVVVERVYHAPRPLAGRAPRGDATVTLMVRREN